MFIGKVCGCVVTSQKDARMDGAKLILVEPFIPSPAQPNKLAPTGKSLVAVDSLGAGVGEFVLVTQGSSARLTDQTTKMPIDAVVIGIIAAVRIESDVISRADGTLVG